LAIPDSALSSGAALKAAEPGKETAEELSDDPKLEAEGGCEKIAGKVHGKICQVGYLLMVMQSPSVGMSTIKKEDQMLWTIAVVLVILWMLGLVSGYAIGNFIHILLVVAIIVVLVRVIKGRRPL
jgi:hypothetical protein